MLFSSARHHARDTLVTLDGTASGLQFSQCCDIRLVLPGIKPVTLVMLDDKSKDGFGNCQARQTASLRACVAYALK